MDAILSITNKIMPMQSVPLNKFSYDYGLTSAMLFTIMCHISLEYVYQHQDDFKSFMTCSMHV